MEETIGGFDRVFSDQVMRSVAIVALGNRTVAAVDPSGVVVLHYMTIGARFRIVGQVGVAPGVHECVQAESDQHAEQKSQGEISFYASHAETE